MLAAAAKHQIPLQIQSVGAMFGLFFTEQTHITNFEQVMQCDSERFKRFFHAMLDQGIYLAPSAFEAGFVSTTHDQAVLDQTLAAAEQAFAQL